jgi:RimJ/RimL family protein N-acetyltransferase
MTGRQNRQAPAFAPLETARLQLRSFQPGDLEPLRTLVGTLSERGHLDEEPRALSRASAVEKGRHPSAGGDYEFAVIARRSGRLVGTCELIVGPRRSGEIGYLLGSRHWGHGYATEMVHALVTFGLDGLGLRSLYAIVSLENARSRRVLQKCGFVWDALLQRSGRAAGRTLDAERYVYAPPPAPSCRRSNRVR